ncbi:hypothetical protein V6L78_18095 [Pseudomonas canadensis]|uniref:hypothetical protein n=1 Tax=Pseudomonas canadensis TaxID=915099 RepID=UPI0030CE8642
MSIMVPSVSPHTSLSIHFVTDPIIQTSATAASGNTSPDRPADEAPVSGNQNLRTALGDRRDLQTLARLLSDAETCLVANASPSIVTSFLQNTPMVVDPASSFRQINNLGPDAPVTLKSFIAGMGTYMPTSRTELLDLARSLGDPALKHPLGNFGGALAWPVPPSIEQQRAIDTLVNNNTPDLPGYTRLGRYGALDYLMNTQRLSVAQLRDTEQALETLLTSPQAQILGNAIQTELQGIASETSVTDYVLAAIHIGLDPESISAPHRNRVANFDLARRSHWGKSADTVINALSRHLEEEGRTAQGRGNLAARVLLAKTAPQFLVKDIPPQVVYGSQAWANFCIAVATQEEDAPGSTRNKTYTQVMSDAEALGIPPSDADVLNALIDWAICNGHLTKKNDEQYNSDDILLARTAFNDQQSTIKIASSHLGDAVPSRKAMALAKLKKQFPEVADSVFEKRVLSIKDRAINPGARSMLDIIMEGHQLNHGETWWTASREVPLADFNAFSQSADSNITEDFTSALDSQKHIQSTLIKYLIADLPLEDRENLEYGKLEFHKEGTYKIGLGLFDSPELTSRKNRLLIKVERNGNTFLYALDPEKGALTKAPNFRDLEPSRTANTLRKTEQVEPTDKSTAHLQDARVNSGPPKSFSSDRTQYIADMYLQALGLEQQARGVTSYDKERGQQEAVTEFLLDLLPLRSAIVNLRDGNYGAAAVDLTLDVFGLISAGLGACAKAIKASKTTSSAVSKLLKAGKILGAASIGELNPLSGAGDVLVGAGKLATRGLSSAAQGIKKLRGIAGNDELIEASNYFESAATGTFKVGEHTVEGSAVLQGGHWYAFDAGKMRPFGSPLQEFSALNVLMPHTPRTHGAVRYDPLSGTFRRTTPNLQPRVPLPLDEYAISNSTNGTLIRDHFTPDRIHLTRKKFSLEMKAFFDDVARRGHPPRPVIPAVAISTTPDQLIAETLKKTDVVVFGEDHEDIASLITLRDSMKTLKDGGVKAIYMEGVTLDAYGLIDDRDLAHSIKNRTGGSTLYEELKTAAEASGIEIMPLEHKYLTQHSDTPGYFYGLDKLPHSSAQFKALYKQRLEEVNYYGARQVMKNELGGKSVVWVGRAHMNSSNNVTGMAELTGGIGIGVYQKTNIGQSMARKETSQKNPSMELSHLDDTAGDVQIDIKV